jgi:hypothetical protein
MAEQEQRRRSGRTGAHRCPRIAPSAGEAPQICVQKRRYQQGRQRPAGDRAPVSTRLVQMAARASDQFGDDRS